MSSDKHFEYKVNAAYTFVGTFTVRAKSEDHAISLVNDHCGMCAGPVHSTLNDDDVTWEFNFHAVRKELTV